MHVIIINPNALLLTAADAEQNYSEDDGWEFITLADQVYIYGSSVYLLTDDLAKVWYKDSWYG